MSDVPMNVYAAVFLLCSAYVYALFVYTEPAAYIGAALLAIWSVTTLAIYTIGD